MLLEKQVWILEYVPFCIFRYMVQLPPKPEKDKTVRMLTLFSHANHQLHLIKTDRKSVV